MKTRIIVYAILVGMVLIIILPVFYQMIHYHYSYEESWLRCRAICARTHGTVWPKNWSEKKFDQITLNMSPESVVKLIGYPEMRLYPDKREKWMYTIGDGRGGWDVRDVQFDGYTFLTVKTNSDYYKTRRDVKVEEITREYFSCK